MTHFAAAPPSCPSAELPWHRRSYESTSARYGRNRFVEPLGGRVFRHDSCQEHRAAKSG
jgi:hypothetical protein